MDDRKSLRSDPEPLFRCKGATALRPVIANPGETRWNAPPALYPQQGQLGMIGTFVA